MIAGLVLMLTGNLSDAGGFLIGAIPVSILAHAAAIDHRGAR